MRRTGLRLLRRGSARAWTLFSPGHANKIIATTIHVSQRTVESHRASMMEKTRSKCIATLARLAVAAALIGPSSEWALHGVRAPVSGARAAPDLAAPVSRAT